MSQATPAKYTATRAAESETIPSRPRRQPQAKARLTEKSGARGESISRKTVKVFAKEAEGKARHSIIFKNTVAAAVRRWTGVASRATRSRARLEIF